MITRPIEERDHGAWRGLFRAYGVFYKTAFDDAVLEGVWAWLMDPDHEVKAVVAVQDDGVVGFAHYRRLADTFVAGPAWFLDDLYVDDDARGAGVGTALIEAVAAETEARGGGTLRWTTATDNLTAQRVYNKVATRTTWVTYEKRA